MQRINMLYNGDMEKSEKRDMNTESTIAKGEPNKMANIDRISVIPIACFFIVKNNNALMPHPIASKKCNLSVYI